MDITVRIEGGAQTEGMCAGMGEVYIGDVGYEFHFQAYEDVAGAGHYCVKASDGSWSHSAKVSIFAEPDADVERRKKEVGILLIPCRSAIRALVKLCEQAADVGAFHGKDALLQRRGFRSLGADCTQAQIVMPFRVSGRAVPRTFRSK